MGKRGMLVLCLNDGEVYSSAAAAAACVGVSKSTMCRHLSGKQPYVKGKEYMYIDPILRWNEKKLLEIRSQEIMNRHGYMII